jgi:carbamate kinase
MRIVIALGGNALLKRGEPMTAENQRNNVRIAAQAMALVFRFGLNVCGGYRNDKRMLCLTDK